MGSSSDYMKRRPYSGQDASQFRMPGYNQWKADIAGDTRQSQARANSAQNSGAQWEQQQRELADSLRNTIAGKGDSAAQRQLMAGLQRTQAMAQSQAAGARGISSGLAGYLANQQAGQAAANTNQQAGILRAQEIANAQGQLGQLAGQARGQDIGREQMYNAMVQDFMAKGMSMDQAQLQANMQLEQMKQQAYQHAQGLEAGTYTHSPGFFDSGGFGQQLLGGLMQAGGSLGAAGILASDKRRKTDIKELNDKEMDAFISSLKGYGYKYKKNTKNLQGLVSEEDRKSKQFGIMAQDLQKTSIGKSFVDTVKHSIYPESKPAKPIKTETTLAIDTRKLTAGLAAAMGRLNERLEALEKKVKK